MADPAHAARGVDGDFEVALLTLSEGRSSRSVDFAGSVAEGEGDGAGALDLEVVVIGGVRVDGLSAEAGAGVINFYEAHSSRAVIFNGGFHEGRAAGGDRE